MHLAAFSSDDGGRLAGMNLTAIAVDKDKTSQQAVKWAVDHLLINTTTIVLIHVRCRPNLGHGAAETVTEVAAGPMEAEMAQLFLPYRGFCARKGLHLKEVTLEESDISKAIVDYINANNITNIVVGASNRNALTRKFRNPDVPTCLLKAVPEFCAVYVISKGKPISVRSAKSPAPVTAIPPRQSLPHAGGSLQLPEPDSSVRSAGIRGAWRGLAPPSPFSDRRSIDRPDFMKTPSRDRPMYRNNMPLDHFEPSIRARRSSVDSRDSFSDDLDFHGSMGSMGSMDFGDSLEFSSPSTESPKEPQSPVSSRDVEAEMRRLRLELKQTMDMYNTACKEAITAKQKAKELHKWKMEEARKFEELRQAEEAALKIAEMEKAKCKAAIEAAQASQRIAELEAQKRLTAELKAKREAEEKKKALSSLAHSDLRYRKYSIEEIEVATNYFSEALKIGEGGYGPVYRASLDHTPVAIKVLRPDAAQGRKQFQQEVEVLSCIRHPNMVLLLGACPEYGCLVYEYMDNGSLEDRLFRRGNSPTIPWSVRFKISAEIATGLLFLHQTKPEPLVHRDLKPANILIDRNYTSKISDVGLARLVPPSVADSVTQYRMTSTAGTFCYIDPEYQQTGMLGIKSDIYSLGIMLLQVVTAKPPMGLTHHVERAIEKGTFEDMLDPSVTNWPVEEALAYAKLALKCAELRRKDRPDLGTVILPELNRLRNLGHEFEASNGSMSVGSFGAPMYAFSHPNQRVQSFITSNQNASAP